MSSTNRPSRRKSGKSAAGAQSSPEDTGAAVPPIGEPSPAHPQASDAAGAEHAEAPVEGAAVAGASSEVEIRGDESDAEESAFGGENGPLPNDEANASVDVAVEVAAETPEEAEEIAQDIAEDAADAASGAAIDVIAAELIAEDYPMGIDDEPYDPDKPVAQAAKEAAFRESPRWNVTTKGIVATASLVMFAIVLWRFRGLLEPLIFAFVLAYLLNPLVSLATRRLNVSRGAAVAIVYLAFILLALGSLAAIGIIAFSQAGRLATTLPTWIQNVTQSIQANILSRTLTFGRFHLNLADQVNQETLSTAGAQMLQTLGFTPEFGGQVASSLLNGALAILSSLFIVMFVAIYLSKDGPELWKSMRNVMRAPGYAYDVERLAREFLQIWNAYLRGQVLLAFSMFVLVSIVLTVLGVNYSLALGGLAGLLEFLPILGPTISTGVTVLVALFQESNWLGMSTFWYIVLIIATMVAMQQLEQAVLVPRFVGKSLELHPLIIIIAVLMGSSLAGILGAILAAPVAATLKLLGTYGWRKMIDRQPFPDPKAPPPPAPERGWRERLAALWTPGRE